MLVVSFKPLDTSTNPPSQTAAVQMAHILLELNFYNRKTNIQCNSNYTRQCLEKSSLYTVMDCEPGHQPLYSRYMGIKFNATVKWQSYLVHG